MFEALMISYDDRMQWRLLRWSAMQTTSNTAETVSVCFFSGWQMNDMAALHICTQSMVSDVGFLFLV